MTSAASLAHRSRIALLIGAILCWAVGITALLFGSRLEWVLDFAPIPPIPTALLEWLGDLGLGDETGFFCWGALVLAWLLFTQWLFLRPRRGWTVELAREGRPMKGAIVAAAFVAMLISSGLVFTLLELTGIWREIGDWPGAWIELPMVAVWVLWAIVFARRWRQQERSALLGRVARRLLVGSVLELLVAIPVDRWSSRREDCYCARGSYLGLVLGGTALMWSFGPLVVLLLVRERVERVRRVPPAVERGSGDV
jgi:hypothetical protein